MKTKQTKPLIGATYKHFRTQNLYRVIAVGKHSETLEDLVFYETLYDNPTAKFWARPLTMFMENVTENGITQPRFTLVEKENK